MKILTPTEKQIRLWLSIFFGIILFFSGCTLSGIDKENSSEITEEDLEAASQILGESLSDDNSGIMSSLNDAVTTISQDGFVRTTAAKGDDDNSGRGRETDITYNYNPETGTHTLTFKREITRSEYFKSVTDTLKYIFTDTNGEFISAPRLQRDKVETIDYKGKRDGMIETPLKNSFFSRQDTFLIDGVSEASSILSIDGVHNGQGRMSGETEDGNTLSRSYEVEINFLNIEIDKAIAQENQSLEEGVTGTLSWEMHIEKQRNGNNSVKTIRGTIEMNGDGTALLRFRNFTKLFQIRLDEGDVHDHNKEFGGHVESVSIDRGTFKLSNGRTIKITDNTNVDPEGDLTTLNQVAATLEDGLVVEAEGKGSLDGDIFVASYVEFEAENAEESDEIRFEAFLSDSKPDLSQFILQDERVILITDNTSIDESGDLFSLAGVKEALELGYNVVADGHGYETDEEGISLIANSVRFDKEGEPHIAFEDLTTEVNLDGNTVTLENGKVVLITEDTDFASDTDYESLGSVKEALGNQQPVITSGKGEETDEPDIDLIATLIRFTNQN